jgi:peptide/nickel transport system permease protein
MKKNKIIKSSLAKRSLHKFLSNRLATIGLAIVLIMLLSAIFAPILSPYDPGEVDTTMRNMPCSARHLLGTDNLGRDLLTRILYGGRVSIQVSFISALCDGAIGVVTGCLAGYFGGIIDTIILFVAEIFSTFPQTILVLILVGFMGQGLSNLIIIFSLTGWMTACRLVRGCIISLREEPFVESCRANGIKGTSIMFRHLLPNTLGPVIVNVTLHIAGFVLAEAGLSFIGLGVPNEIPTWGNIINAAKSLNVMQNFPIQWVAPGVTISLFVLGVNFLGDGLRDVFDTTQ